MKLGENLEEQNSPATGRVFAAAKAGKKLLDASSSRPEIDSRLLKFSTYGD